MYKIKETDLVVGGDFIMKEDKTLIKAIAHFVFFSFLISLIVMGQKNIGLVKWIGNVFQITNLKPIGLGIMIIAILGLLFQLYCYNKKYQ